MAFAACVHNVKYFAPIAASRLYEQRRVFQQINRRALSAKNIDRTNSLWNDGYKTVETYAAVATAQAQVQVQQPTWYASSSQPKQQSPTQTQTYNQHQKELQ